MMLRQQKQEIKTQTYYKQNIIAHTVFLYIFQNLKYFPSATFYNKSLTINKILFQRIDLLTHHSFNFISIICTLYILNFLLWVFNDE